MSTGEHGLWGEGDEGLAQTAAWARELGIRTLLKPHLWVRHGEWPGDLEMQSEADWATWFAAYERFIVHYAEMAERTGMEAFAIGTELRQTTRRTAEWRRLIAQVRRVYHGPLTYCANWREEVEHIEFWGDLDFIGVQAYYPLGDALHPSPQQIRAAWRPFVTELESVSRSTGKPIVFSEVGYKSMAGTLSEPWVWDVDGEVDFELQRDAYRILFETFWQRPWFGGTFIWKWHPYVRNAARLRCDFTPQGKPALTVIRAWYSAAGMQAPVGN
jgi:hypothetical protein